MKKLFKKGVAFTLSLALSMTVLFPALSKEAVKTAEAADTSVFDDLSQDEIVEAMGAGWNLGNQLEATNGDGYPILAGTGWTGIAPTPALFKAVKNAGFDTVRIPVSYLNYIEGNSYSGYYINDSWMAYVKSVVQMALDADLYVIVNMHGDGYESVTGSWLLCGASDQTSIRTKFAGAWEDIANNLNEFDEHLIFEAMNEEYKATDGGGWLYDKGQETSGFSTAYANIEALNQIFVDTVRQTGGNNAKRWLMVAGWDTNIDLTADSAYYNFTMPTDNYRSSSISSSEKRLMASVHYYTPWDFCGDGNSDKTQWGAITTDESLVGGYGGSYASNRYGEDYLEYEFNLLKTKFTSKGYPVVIGEYGSINKNNEAYRAYFAKRVCEESKDAGCIPVIWDNNGAGTGKDKFQIIDRSTNSIAGSADEIVAAINDVYGSGSGSETTDTETLTWIGSASNYWTSSSTIEGSITTYACDFAYSEEGYGSGLEILNSANNSINTSDKLITTLIADWDNVYITITTQNGSSGYLRYPWSGSEIECPSGTSIKITSTIMSAECAEIYGTQGDTITKVVFSNKSISSTDFTPYTLYTQKTDVENSKYSQRWVMLVPDEDLATLNSGTLVITRTNDNKKMTVTLTKCYNSVSAAGSKITAPAGYKFVAYALLNIPEEINLSANTITFS